MAIYRGGNNRSLSCLRLLLRQQQRNRHAFAEESQRSPKTHSQVVKDVVEAKPRVARVDMKKWKKLDSRALGIERGAIPAGPWTIMKILRNEGFDSYLVGGCVRDLLLKKTPKDFDVITTATLRQIKKQFHRAEVVGHRFPICVVHIRGSTTEVSSFETIAKHAEPSKQLHFSQAPHGCEIKDFTLWRDSMRRDFTVNSLFLDPFSNLVYDYSSGMSDLMSLKLRTIIPAKVSFEEDCARILRGLRIAARLGLSFSKDTETALLKLSPSVTRLGKARLFMEVNYMLSYGAAEPSLSLLQKFNLLEPLLPLQAVYLEKPPSAKSGQNSRMLMKLLSNLDKVVNCDHPTDCRLWVGLLAFHITLVNNPQDAFVVLTLASILYHGEWKEGIRYARENAEVEVHFRPELLGSSASKSDEELADEVSQLAAFIQDSVSILTEPEILLASMSRYPTSLCSGLVYIPYRVGQDVAELFQMLVKQNPFNENKREDFVIDYNLLGKGFMWETRFVLGKIILETIGCKTFQSEENAEKNETIVEEASDEDRSNKLSSLLKKHVLVKKLGKSRFSEDTCEEKQKVSLFAMDRTPKKNLTQQEIVIKKHQKVDDETDNPSRKMVISMVEDMLEKRYESLDEKLSLKKKKSEVLNEEIIEEKKENYEKKSEALKEEIIEEKKEESKKRKKRKSNNSKEKTPRTDESCESADSELTVTKEEKGEDVKKSKKKRKSSELLEEKETEKKSRDVKKTKSNSKAIKNEEKDEDDDKKKNSKISELLVEEVTEKKNENVKKTKRKNNSKRSVKDPEKELSEPIVGKKKRDSKRSVKDPEKELSEPIVGKKKRDSKKEEVESNNDLIQEDNKEMVRRKMDENEWKQVVENKNENKSRTLLSSLFR